jgi:DNA-binding transcriptional ArsR family regulator
MKNEAELFKVLADPTRMKLAVLLSIKEEICVCALAQALAEPDYKISRHIGIMRSANLVEARREGTWMYYRLAKPKSRMEESLRELFRNSLTDHPAVKASLERLDQAQCGDQGKKRSVRVLFREREDAQATLRAGEKD